MIPVPFGGSIILLLEADTIIYVSFTGFTFGSTSSRSSRYEKRRPKRAFEALLVVGLVLLTASCSSSPADVVVVVVFSPVVEADTGVIVADTKIIVSVKIVAATVVVARRVLFSRGIFLILLSLLLLFSVFILRASGMEKQRIKTLQQLTRKGCYEQDFIVSSNNVLSLDMTIIKSFLVTQRSPLVLLQSPWSFFSSHSKHESKHFSLFSRPIKT